MTQFIEALANAALVLAESVFGNQRTLAVGKFCRVMDDKSFRTTRRRWGRPVIVNAETAPVRRRLLHVHRPFARGKNCCELAVVFADTDHAHVVKLPAVLCECVDCSDHLTDNLRR